MILIDADKCPCKHCKRCNYVHATYCVSFERWITKTAYDIDKVCEEIDRYSIDNTDWSYSTNPELASYYLLRTKDAIEIVKRGEINV